MNRFIFYILITIVTVPDTIQAQDYDLDDWMTISSVDMFEWSPDGQFLYYTSNAAPSGTYNIFRVKSEGGPSTPLGEDEINVRPERREQLTISPDGESIYFAAASYFSAYLNLYRMPSSGGTSEALTYNDGMIQSSPTVSPDNNILAFFARTQAGAKIFTLDLTRENAWPKQVLPGDETELFPAWSSKGDLAFQRRGDIWVKRSDVADPFRPIDPAFGGRNSGIAWAPIGDRIAFTNARSGFPQVGVVDINTGEVISITDASVQHGQVSWSPDGRWLVFIRADKIGMSNEIVVTSADGSGRQRVLTTGKGRRFAPKFSPDGKSIAYVESNSVRTRDIWTIPVEGGIPKQITYSMGTVNPDDLTIAQEMFYHARDNLRIPGMLWLPPKFDPTKKYPVIVRIHGHPGQWNHDFRMMTQNFVQKGFVVVAPNPRGSAGFGQGFHDLHIADWGGEEYYDVMGVVKYLETLGYADTDNMATWGGSGGGYM
ncbi:MAG: S9 family peptidase, partial [Gammaproteobacteria bacterium]|nr:S9 family peptidase [Gammaproteobacteria bacterium]